MATNPPNTRVRMSHALTIRARGQTVGLIQSFAPAAQTRAIPYVYELSSATSGEPVERPPGNLGGLSINITRYDLYTKKMETAFGTADFIMLSDQNEKFQIREVWRNPDGQIESYVYLECLFSNIGRQYSAVGDRIVMTNATVEYLKKVKV
jgi:hypothetical protein